ncbi:MAG: 2-hydroxyacyl-CoA dehydratase [Clostridia bacterium]|nr:2-hydroxyacyl-CoA dehydratase [Clostridia bacterium]
MGKQKNIPNKCEAESCADCRLRCDKRETTRAVFTKEMKATHTILMPNMLPIHLELACRVLRIYGYNAVLMEYGLHGDSRKVIDAGLLNVHNDICYPAQLIIGQMLEALQSGDYDPHKIAFLYPQTGGGCRASNYIHLARKALKKAGYDYVPVISVNFAGLEKNPGFKVSARELRDIMYVLYYGDLLMCLVNQSKPYEIEKGSADALASRWVDTIIDDISHLRMSKRHIRQNYIQIIKDFEALPKTNEKKVRVGIVGEIFVKFSPLGNNELEKYLIAEGAEPVLAGLMDFIMYCVANMKYDYAYYGIKRGTALIGSMIYPYLTKKQKEISELITQYSSFRPMPLFPHTEQLVDGVISHAVKMGEGWLLTAEMLELADMGVENIVVTQPFGCLPNHIVGKGMMKPVKERCPDVNLVAIDYDAGATRINQENRLKLMLANAKQLMEKHNGVE